MTEEKIIEILKKLISWKSMKVEIRDYEIDAIQGLLDLYDKEKEKYLQLFEEYNKRVNTIINYEQGLKEIIDAEDDPDTWAYHAVKKLLKEVGGIDYE